MASLRVDVGPTDSADQCDLGGSAAEEVSVTEVGTVSTPDEQLVIEVEPGDLGSDTTISVTEFTVDDPEVNLSVGSGPGAGQALALYVLAPDGTQFANSVSLTIKADVTALTPAQRDAIDLYRSDDTDTFVSLGAICSVLEGPIGTFVAQCTVELDHFSTYAIVVPLDSDGDGVPDNFDGLSDACPSVDATGFDADNDGCIDSFNGLADLLTRLVSQGVISANMQNSLMSKISNAGHTADRGNICAAINELGAFINQVTAQTGKKISVAAASAVIDYANSVIAYQHSQLPAGETCP